MKFVDIRALPGPNIYTHRSVLVGHLDLQDLTEKDTAQHPGFTDRLLMAVPGLADHHCGLGYPGGFVERLREGTFFGHVVEHVALELQTAAGAEVRHGKTRATRTPGVYRVVVEYRNEAAGRLLLETARELVEAALAGREYPVAEKVEEARRVARRTDLGPSTKAVADAAAARGIPVVRLDDGSLIQLGTGVHRKLVQATETAFTSSVSVDIACDKARTKAILERAEVPVPRGIVARSVEEAVVGVAELAAPFAVKPLNGNQGRGITLGVRTADDLRAAFARAAATSPDVVVEEQFAGRDYRVLVVAGKMVAASERRPAQVVGDRVHTVADLIRIENETNPLRGDGHEQPLTRIVVDDAVREHLRQTGRGLDEVPAAGQVVTLRGTANLSTGGTARDVTDEVHPAARRLCERAARVIGLDVCGLDLMTPEIGEPLPATGAGVIEANAAPGIRMHHYPAAGKPRDAGGAIVDMLFPGGSTGRVPVVSITGTNGKTTVTRMVAAAVAAAGKTVGMTTTDGIWVDGHEVARGDMTGFNSARVVLGDPAVEVAVLETARGGIVRRSLGYDWSDVGVITNIAADHLGQDGIETIDDLVFAKSLVAERTRDGGTLVMNADDPRVMGMLDRRLVRAAHKRVVLFSLDARNPAVARHLADGGTCVVAADGWLIESDGHIHRRIVRAADVPATFGGTAGFQVANALAAAAAARAVGVPVESIAAALKGFGAAAGANPGRMNLFRSPRGHVVVDYGHNPAAFAAVAGLTRHWHRRVTAVFTAPGDRDDELIRECGRTVARGFDRLIIREDADLRGRRPGEVSRLLCEAAHAEDRAVECHTILDECEATRAALDGMGGDDVAVVFYEDFDAVLEVLREHGAEPCDRLPADEPALAGVA